MRIIDFLKLLLLAALWSSSFLFTRIAAPVLGPIWLIEFRVLLAGLLLLPILAQLGLVREMQANWKPLVIVGCFNSAIPFSLFAFSSVYLPSGFTSILNATVPLFGILVASVWLREKLSSTRIVGFILGFIGVMVLVGWTEFALTREFWAAVSTGLVAALLYAIAAPYIKLQLVGVSPLTITTGSQLSAALFLWPAMPLTIPDRVPSAIVIFSVLGLAVLSSVFAYILYFHLIETIGSTKSLTVAYLIPLFAIILGAVVLNETVTLSMIIGCGLILLGTAIANDLL
jgi:drug/metabolite transporter (DMT)-like permease